MYLPGSVRLCLDALKQAGFRGYAVGGCVRDMLAAGEAVGVPNSETMIPVEGKVLASKRVNAEMYSASMQKAGSTVAINVNYDAIEAYVTGKTIAELEAELAGKTAEEVIDAVAGCTLADTLGYINGIIAAAKNAQ